METKQIKLSGLNDALEFVAAAETCSFDVDIRFNRIIIDAKSIIGVCSLDLSHVLTVTYQGQNPPFEQLLEKYRAA